MNIKISRFKQNRQKFEEMNKKRLIIEFFKNVIILIFWINSLIALIRLTLNKSFNLSFLVFLILFVFGVFQICVIVEYIKKLKHIFNVLKSER